eukprot:12120593-Alexandrium_andersonii.AAC.1
MSASLVGSEMCIRDSCDAQGCNSPRGASAARSTRARAISSSVALPPARSCLLYTSDAADDM